MATIPNPLFEAANAVYAAQLGEIAWHEITIDPSIAAMTAEHTMRVRSTIDINLKREAGRPLRFLEIAPYCHYTAQEIAASHGAVAHVFDISPDSLRTAAGLAREAGVAGDAIGTAGDFHDLPYRDDWFDVVFVASAVHHTWRPERVLGEMLRVLRPGGLLMLDNEPVGARLCLYLFRSNRAESYTPFERTLSDQGALHAISSPFLGSRPEELFGMVENDRIPLATWEQALAGHSGSTGNWHRSSVPSSWLSRPRVVQIQPLRGTSSNVQWPGPRRCWTGGRELWVWRCRLPRMLMRCSSARFCSRPESRPRRTLQGRPRVAPMHLAPRCAR